MEGDTARTVGYALGLAFMGYIVLQAFNSRSKKPTYSEPNRASGNRIAMLSALAAIVVGIGAAVLWLAANE